MLVLSLFSCFFLKEPPWLVDLFRCILHKVKVSKVKQVPVYEEFLHRRT